MNFTYRIVHDDDGCSAECLEVEVVGEGETPDEAARALEELLRERMLRPDAVAPPPEMNDAKIELTRVPDA
jgi:hypothetical protein